MKAGGLLENQRAGCDGGKRRSTTREKKMTETRHLRRDLRDVLAPRREIILHGGSGGFQFVDNGVDVIAAQRAAQPLEGDQRGEISFAGNGKFGTGTEKHDDV